MKKVIIKLLSNILIVLVPITGCSSQTYSAKKIYEDESILHELENKHVEIFMLNDKKYEGYFHQFNPDSAIISLPGSDRDVKIVLNEISSIKTKRINNAAIGVGIILFIAIFYLLLQANVTAAQPHTR